LSLNTTTATALDVVDLENRVLDISRITSICLIVAYATYVWFQMRTHKTIYNTLLEADEQLNEDRHKDLQKDKLTLTECVFALTISIALVTLIAINCKFFAVFVTVVEACKRATRSKRQDDFFFLITYSENGSQEKSALGRL